MAAATLVDSTFAMASPELVFGFPSGSLFWFLLSRRLYPIEFVVPETLEVFHPVMHGFQFSPVKAVKPLLALLRYRDEADLSQHTQMFGNRRLRKIQPDHQLPHCMRLARGKHLNNLPSPWLGDRIKRITGGGCSGHTPHYILMLEYVKRSPKI